MFPLFARHKRHVARCLSVFLCLLLAAQAGAASPERTLAQREHTAWTERSGAPERVSSFAQTADGWLWLCTPRGLFRFDGMRFEQVQPAFAQRFPDTDVYALHADPAGGLWIGWRTGGIRHLRDGAVRNWSAKDGLPHGSIWGFAQDGQGLWAAGLDGLAWFDGTAWKRIGEEQGFSARKASSVFVSADGTVAVLSELGLFLRAPGARRFTGPVGKLDARQPFLQRRHADTCCRIAEEALRNACRHGAAAHVAMTLGRAGDELTLAVRDDGIGIGSDLLKAGKQGHWGLAGMHERALLAGGRLDIVTGTGTGTELTLQLPLAKGVHPSY